MLDIQKIRADFPILKREVRPGIPLVYLDTTATSQKPMSVIQAMDDFYMNYNANIHRGVYSIAEEATTAYERAREKIARFVGVKDPRQLIYTRNTTESINLVAYTWGHKFLHEGDLIIATEMEHHSNLVPWQMLAEEKKLKLEFIPITDRGELNLDEYRKLLELSPKLVTFTHMSNVLGTINPAKEIIHLAHQAGAVTLVDAAQSIPHFPVDLTDLDADFAAFSAHKMLGPTGIGILFGKTKLLEAMPPFMGGGDMIAKVQLRGFTTNDLPYKFEAGTSAIAEAIGFGAAIDYLNAVGMVNVAAYEQEIVKYAIPKLVEIPGVKVYGPPAEKKGAVIVFSIEGIHPHDVAQVLDENGIAVRAGHHCAMPLHQKLDLLASTRASFYIYNTKEEVDFLVKGIQKVIDYFK
jgi:cysteine desulfurase/selenocysteine lyase